MELDCARNRLELKFRKHRNNREQGEQKGNAKQDACNLCRMHLQKLNKRVDGGLSQGRSKG